VEKATVEAVSAYISKSLIRDLSDPVFGFPEEVPKSEEVEVEVELIELRTCEGEVVEEVATWGKAATERKQQVEVKK